MYAIKEMDVATLLHWQKSGVSYRLFDVRSQPEIARGIIAGAEILPLHLIPLNTAAIETAARVSKAVIYCRTGARSGQACAFFAQRGVEEVYNLRGGIVAWQHAGEVLIPPPHP